MPTAAMSTEAGNAMPADPGLVALLTLLYLRGVTVHARQITDRLGTDKIGAPEMLRFARAVGLKACVYRTDCSRLTDALLPAIASLCDGGFLVVAKAGESTILVQFPLTHRPTLLTREELAAAWDGRLILMTWGAGWSEIIRRFVVSIRARAPSLW